MKSQFTTNPYYCTFQVTGTEHKCIGNAILWACTVTVHNVSRVQKIIFSISIPSVLAKGFDYLFEKVDVILYSTMKGIRVLRTDGGLHILALHTL